jgi:hypothetical protein
MASACLRQIPKEIPFAHLAGGASVMITKPPAWNAHLGFIATSQSCLMERKCPLGVLMDFPAEGDV